MVNRSNTDFTVLKTYISILDRMLSNDRFEAAKDVMPDVVQALNSLEASMPKDELPKEEDKVTKSKK